VGYVVALFFLSQAYTFRLPAMLGLAITLSFAANRTMRPDHDQLASGSPQPYPQRANHR
jgi:hypothetical protein